MTSKYNRREARIVKSPLPPPTTTTTTSINSIVNLFKLVSLVVFINYELINQQQVTCRSRDRGLIYNKDGKFIYRPAKSSQGHIIVIDDRQRESDTKKALSAGVAISDLPKTGAESAYSQPAIQLISPRVYHPHEAAAHMAVGPIRAAPGGFYPGGQQIELINLNELQSIAHLPTAASFGSVRMPTSSSLQPSNSLNHLQIMPLVHLYPPARYHHSSALNFLEAQPIMDGGSVSMQPNGMGIEQIGPIGVGGGGGGGGGGGSGGSMINSNGGGSNDGKRGNGGGNGGSTDINSSDNYHPSQRHRVYEAADTPIGTFEPPNDLDNNPSINLFDDNIPLEHTRARGGGGGGPRGRAVDFTHMLDAQGSRVDYHEERFNNNGPNNTPPHQQRKPTKQINVHQADNSALSDLLSLPMNGIPSPKSRASKPTSLGPEVPGSLGKTAKYLKRGTQNPKRKVIETRRLLSEVQSIMNNQDDFDPKNNAYWKQFKDQYDILK